MTKILTKYGALAPAVAGSLMTPLTGGQSAPKAARTIVEQTSYFALPGKAEDVYRVSLTCAVAPSADSRVYPVGSSLRASLRWLPQTNLECRVPTVRQHSPKRRVVQAARSRRTCASQMMGGVTLRPCRENCYWQQSALAATRLRIL